LADDHYALDISRARNLLGWSPQHNVRDTLPRMVFYRLNKLEGTPPRQEVSIPARAVEHRRRA
jgi:hypothetical protein